MVTFRDLGDISIGTLYKTYDEAFCDYPVNLGFDEAKLQNCFDRRGCEGFDSGDSKRGFRALRCVFASRDRIHRII